MKVKEIMSFPAITENEDASVAVILKHMELSRIGGVVITKEGKPVGITVDYDIAAKNIYFEYLHDEKSEKNITYHITDICVVKRKVKEENGIGIDVRS